MIEIILFVLGVVTFAVGLSVGWALERRRDRERAAAAVAATSRSAPPRARPLRAPAPVARVPRLNRYGEFVD